MNQELLTYIEQSPSMFHTAQTTARLLSENGFTYLDESSNWALMPGGKYYTTRNSSSLLAWRMPKGDFTGFMAMAAHSDSPFLKLKENAEQFDEHYVRLSVERYGSPLLAPWFDRPLSVAGRVLIRTEEGFTERLVDMAEPVAVIPSLAIHMNREANDKASYNMAVDMLPLIGERGDGVPDLRTRIAEKLGIKNTDILTTELYMYNCQKGMEWSNYISAPRLDDLQCAFQILCLGDETAFCITLRIILWCSHITFTIHHLIPFPVDDRTAGNTHLEDIGIVCYQRDGHESAIAPTMDTQAVHIYIGQGAQIVNTFHLVLHLNLP